MNIQEIQTFLGTTAIDLAIKVLAAIAFWVVGRWLINLVVSLMQRAMSRNHVDPTLTKYLGSIVAVMLSIALVLGILGIVLLVIGLLLLRGGNKAPSTA